MSIIQACLLALFLTFIHAGATPLAALAQQQAASNRPIVGVAGSGYQSRSVRYAMAALWDAGAYPVLLDTRKPDALQSHMAALNAAVIAGNSMDINPADYGAAAIHARTKNEDEHAQTEWDKKRDDYEYALLDAVVQQQLPFLGICSGAQRLNVANAAQDGGTLGQHVNGQMVVSQTQLPHQPALQVQMVQGSRVASITQDKYFSDNSLHHQYISTVRKGFRAAAFDAKSGNVEAIEPDPDGRYAGHPFMLGVQWHPEYGASAASKRLIASLVKAAKMHAQTHPKTHAQALAIDASPPPLRLLVQQGVSGMRRQLGYSQPAWVFE